MVDKVKRDPQATGGCYTYAMRYVVQVHLGWGMPDLDDEGNDASGIVTPEQELELIVGVFNMQQTAEGLQTAWSENGEVINRIHANPEQYEKLVAAFQGAMQKLQTQES